VLPPKSIPDMPPKPTDPKKPVADLKHGENKKKEAPKK
jgi:hypothetical protein